LFVADQNTDINKPRTYSGLKGEDSCIALFIDNSNLFIEGKKFYAKHLKLNVAQDPSFRIDIGKLCDAILGKRTLNYGKLYGSEPPSLDTVWRKIREHGLNVSTYQKNYLDKEKEIDNALTADATEYVCTWYNEFQNGTVIIVAGDRDYCPVVEKILKKGWNVEVVAFEVSISSKLKSLEKSNKLFQIKMLEQMFDLIPHWYYVNRRFKSNRPNVRQRIRMPRSRTMILEFVEDFIVDVDEKNIMKLTDELTKLLRIPCLFKPWKNKGTNKTCILFIIGLPKSNLEKTSKQEHDIDETDRKWREDLRIVGLQEDQIEVMIAKNRRKPLKHAKSADKIEFCKLCKDKLQCIKDICKKLVGELRHCKTMVEYLQSTSERDRLQIENRFTPLDDDFDCSMDETDYDYDSDDDEEEDLDDHEVDHGDGEYQEVSRNRQVKWVGTLSEMCKYSFNCNNGQRCRRKHSTDEEAFFKMNEGNGARGYKSKPCDRYINRHACPKGRTDKAPMCTYYHSLGEARCYQCQRYDGFVGHAATECPTLVQLADDECIGLNTESCDLSFSCRKGSACEKKHTADEEAFFKTNGGKGVPSYKAKRCEYFQQRACSRGKYELAPMCAFYHSKEEARCYECGKIGHAFIECTERIVW